MSDLKNKAVNSVLWSTVRTVIMSLSGPLLLIVQARYLSPAEFGVMAILNVFISIITVIENFGLGTAVIQKDIVTKNERSSLFFFQIILSSFFGLLLIVFSPVVGDIFDMGMLDSLLPLLSLTIFFNGPVVLFTAFLEKEFHFKSLSIIQIVQESTLFLTTAIFLIFFDMGLLGVVVGKIISVAVAAISIIYESFRHDLLHLSMHFKISEVRPFIKFGVMVFVKQISTQVTHHIDEVIIGYFLTAEALGYYHFAKNLLNKLRAVISTSFAKVLFPLLSQVKNDIKRLTNAYNTISKFLGMFAFPIFIGIAITSHLFIPVFFGEEWLRSVPYFVILSVAYIPYLAITNLATSLLYSVNKPTIVLKVELFVNVGYVVLLLVLSWMNIGIYPVVILYAIYLTVKTTILQLFTNKYLLSSFIEYLKLFKNSVLGSIFMAILVLITQWTLFPFVNHLVELLISIAIGFGSYLVAYILLDRQTIIEFISLIKRK